MREEFVWAEKYRPNTLEECVLPAKLKEELVSFVSEKGSIINSIFSGGPGTGKTTAAKAICKELGADFLFLKGSGSDRGIASTGQIVSFATKMSIEGSGARKIVIYDEADNLTHDAQMALRTIIDEVSRNCGFILTCNYPGRLIEPLRSRCDTFDFSIPKAEKNEIAKQYIVRTLKILREEGITNVDTEAVKKVVIKNFPDFRKVLNVIQKVARNNSVNMEDVNVVSSSKIMELVGFMKAGEWTNMRKWVGETPAAPIEVILELWKVADKIIAMKTLPLAAFILNEGQTRDPMAADKTLNLTAVCTELMRDCEFL